MKRPLSVTIIAVIVLAGAILGLFFLVIISSEQFANQSRLFVNVSYKTLLWVNMFYNLLNVAIGIGLLKRKDWARKLLIYLYPIFIIISYFMMIDHVFWWFGIIGYAIYFYFLNSKKAVAYFEGTLLPEDTTASVSLDKKDRINTPRKIFAIIILVVGSYLLFVTMFLSSIPLEETGVKIIMISLFGGLSLFVLVPGILLWGKTRWKKSTATVLISCGAFFLLSDLIMYLFFHSSYATQLPETSTKIFNSETLINSIIISLVILTIGLLLILNQKKKEKTNSFEADTL